MNEKQGKLWNELLDVWGDWRVAATIELGRRYLTEYPKDGAAWLILADIYTYQARYKDALNALRKAQKYIKKDRHDMVFVQYGHLYREKGNYKASERWYRKAIEEKPDNPRNYIFLGAILAKMGRFEEAKSFHLKAIMLNKDLSEEAHYNLGLLYRAEGDYKKAIKHFETAIAIDPDYTVVNPQLDDLSDAIQIKKDKQSC